MFPQNQQRVHAHKAILSRFPLGVKLFSVFPFLHSQTEAFSASSLLLLPDWTKSQVEFRNDGLEELKYLNNSG